MAKSVRRFSKSVAIGCVMLWAWMAGAGLVPCPDCGQPVSERAVFCPHCGCPGEAIAEAVHARKAAQKPIRPAFFDSIVEVRSDREHGWGTVVADAGEGAAYVVTSFDILGAQSLELRSLLTTSVVTYASIELADDCSLVRLRTADTNVPALAWAPAGVKGFFALHEPATNVLQLVPARLTADGVAHLASPLTAIPLGAPVLSPSTNLMGVVVATKPGFCRIVSFSESRRWIAVQPREFRRQVALLAEARQAVKSGSASAADRRQLVHRLREAAWSTSFEKQQAKLLASQLDPSEMKP